MLSRHVQDWCVQIEELLCYMLGLNFTSEETVIVSEFAYIALNPNGEIKYPSY